MGFRTFAYRQKTQSGRIALMAACTLTMLVIGCAGPAASATPLLFQLPTMMASPSTTASDSFGPTIPATTSPLPAYTPRPTTRQLPGGISPATILQITEFAHQNPGPISQVGWSGDGTWIAAASTYGISIYNATTFQLTRSIKQSGVLSLAFSPDGKMLSSGNTDGSIGLWNPSTGAALGTLRGHIYLVSSLAFSPDGSLLASGGRDGSIVLWDPVSEEQVRRIDAPAISGLAFSPDGGTLAAALGEGGIGRWDPSSGSDLGTIKFTNGEQATAIAFSPDGSLLVSSGYRLTLWDATQGTELRSLEPEWDGIEAPESFASLLFSPNSQVVVAGSIDGTIHFLDTETGNKIRILEAGTARISSLALSPDGAQLVSGSVDGTLRLWGAPRATASPTPDQQTSASPFSGRPVISPENAAQVTELSNWNGGEKYISYAAWSADGKQLAFPTTNGVTLLDSETLQQTKLLAISSEFCTVPFSPDDNTFAAYATDGSGGVSLWDMTTGTMIKTLSAQGLQVVSCTFLPSGPLLAAGTENGTVLVWNTRTGNEIWSHTNDHGSVSVLTFPMDGKTLAALFEPDFQGNTQTIRLWDAASGNELRTLTLDDYQAVSLAFSPEGRTLAVSSLLDDSVELLDLTGGSVRRLWIGFGHTDSVFSLAFSPDGRTLASGGLDHTIILWDSASGARLQTLIGHNAEIQRIVFSPDGTRLLSLSEDGIAYIWGIKP
jgi:WD40 repeat protein